MSQGQAALIEELKSLLQAIEWAGVVVDFPACPACGSVQNAGAHYPGCKLTAALVQLKAMEG